MSESNLIERSTDAARHIDLPVGSTMEHVLYGILVVKTLTLGHCPEYSTASRAVVSKGTDELGHLLIMLNLWVTTPGPKCQSRGRLLLLLLILSPLNLFMFRVDVVPIVNDGMGPSGKRQR